MAMVCKEEFPETGGFSMDRYLQENLDILADSIVEDFDFIILVTGRGMTRAGKSRLASQVGSYLTSRVKAMHKKEVSFTCANYSFRGDHLIKNGKSTGKYHSLVYDEAGSDLQAKKVMHSTTQALLDYIRECGQLNQFLICVLPDYFDLPKSIALTRSVCLIDVDFKEKFIRGKYRFYGRRSKKLLYLKGKKYLDYDSHPPDFFGTFPDFLCVDEKEYNKMKVDALMGREQQVKDKVSDKYKRLSRHRRLLINWIWKEHGHTQVEIGERLGITGGEVSTILHEEDLSLIPNNSS